MSTQKNGIKNRRHTDHTSSVHCECNNVLADIATPIYKSTYGLNTPLVNAEKTAKQARRQEANTDIIAAITSALSQWVYIVESNIKKASERVSAFENGLTV